MKFKNPKTGELFDTIQKARKDVCWRYTVQDCARGLCPLQQSGDASDIDCDDFCDGAPEVAAKLMGLEVLPDTAPDAMPRGTEAKHDTGKPRPTLVPPSLVEAVTAVREVGTRKYGDPENWRKVEPQRYRDALYRHWLAYLKGEAVDAESGLPHLHHVACNVAFLIELEGENT